MRFEFATSSRIIFGPGVLHEIGAVARAFGSRALVVTGRDPARAAPLNELLTRSGTTVTACRIDHEPTIDDVMRGVAVARDAHCDHVIGFGGGAALDAAKAISALVTNRGDIFDFLEVIGRALPIDQPALPCIAIPTTAGTGSEVTRNAVLASPTHRVKVSLRSPQLLPRVALVDPTLTHSLPPGVTATTGLDALTQLIEPYTSTRANPITDALCVEGIRRVARSLQSAVENGNDASAREDLALASLFGGLALANAGLGAVHGFAGPIGGMFAAPHGAICAALLPGVMAANLAALRSRDAQNRTLSRYDEVARLLTGNADATSAEGVEWIRALVAALKIPALHTYGISRSNLPAIVEASAKASSMKANPIVLTADELHAVAEQAL